MRGRMLLVAGEYILAGEIGHIRLAGHPSREHQLLRPQAYFLTIAIYVDNPLFPAALVFISALFVSFCFLQIYGMAITTILLSFCLDEDKFKNGLYEKKLGDDGEC